MSLSKMSFCAMLAAILAVAALGFNRHLREVHRSQRMADRKDPGRADNFPARSEQPADLIPIQSKNPDNLGVGKLLVASRYLGDPQFAKTVILLVHYDAQGVLGLMLNRRTKVPLSRALQNLKAAKDRSDAVYVGGPVEMEAVFALLKSQAKPEEAEHVFDGVYLIAAKPLFEQTLSARPDASVFHVYLGYAGWSEEQLRQEVGLGAWFVFPAEARTVFNADPDSLWPEMIRKTEMQMVRRHPEGKDSLATAG
jgi:putative transcriptional regulator